MLKSLKLPPLLWLAFVVLTAAAPADAFAQGEASLPELIRRVKPSVVSVLTYNAKNEPLMTGSGFFVSPTQVVTNLHVVERAHRVDVRTYEGKGKTYAVEALAGIDEEGDLAVLTLKPHAARAASADDAAAAATTTPVASPHQALELAAALPEEGERIFVIGNPLRLEGSVSDGIVSAVREVPNLGRIVQITAPISHGNSGSPLFNMRGQVVGVITVKVTNGQNINLAIEAERVAELRKREKPISFEQLAARARRGQAPEAVSDWWYRNGLNSLWLGNYESALANFENAIDRNPARVEAWIQVGFCKVKQGKNSDAVRAFQQAIRLRPNSVEAHNKLGDAYYYAGNYPKAVESYKEAARIQPRMAEAFYNLGMAYLELGDRAAAAAQTHILKPLDEALYRKLVREIEK